MTLDSDWATWTTEEEREFFKQIELRLEKRLNAGEHPGYSDVIYAIAEEIAEAAGESSDPLGDELNDAANNGISALSKGTPFWTSWTGSMIGSTSGGVEVLDFGTGKHIVMEAPDLDAGTDWQVLAIVDPEDKAGIRDATMDFIAYRGWMPDNLTFGDELTRRNVETAYEAAFDSGLTNDWSAVQEPVAQRVVVVYPIQTKEERSKLLGAWLDLVIG